MITVRNRKNRPSSLLFDPLYFNPHPATKSYQKPELKPRIFTNVLKTEDGFTLELAAPGFKKEDFSIDIEKNRLTVSFENKIEKEVLKYSKQEFVIGDFTKSFNLSTDIDLEKITANYELGILKITLFNKPNITKKIDIL